MKTVNVVGYDALNPQEKKRADGIINAIRKSGYRVKKIRCRGRRP